MMLSEAWLEYIDGRHGSTFPSAEDFAVSLESLFAMNNEELQKVCESVRRRLSERCEDPETSQPSAAEDALVSIAAFAVDGDVRDQFSLNALAELSARDWSMYQLGLGQALRAAISLSVDVEAYSDLTRRPLLLERSRWSYANHMFIADEAIDSMEFESRAFPVASLSLWVDSEGAPFTVEFTERTLSILERSVSKAKQHLQRMRVIADGHTGSDSII